MDMINNNKKINFKIFICSAILLTILFAAVPASAKTANVISTQTRVIWNDNPPTVHYFDQVYIDINYTNGYAVRAVNSTDVTTLLDRLLNETVYHDQYYYVVW